MNDRNGKPVKIYDEAGNEITEADVDTSKGRLESDKKFIVHHDAEAAVAQVKHYRVKTVYFEDATSIDLDGDNTDSHLVVIDDKQGVFEYIDETRDAVRGMDLEEVIDVEKKEAKEAYDEYEDIQVYKLYTAAELKERQEAKEKMKKQQDFMTNGPDQLKNNTNSIDDLYITIADITAGSGE